MKPRKNYRSRPKKHGAERNKRIIAQKKRLIEAGCKEEDLKKLNVVEIRNLIKSTMKKVAKTARQEKQKAAPKKIVAKKTVAKKTIAKKTETVAKKETAPKKAATSKETETKKKAVTPKKEA